MSVPDNDASTIKWTNRSARHLGHFELCLLIDPLLHFLFLTLTRKAYFLVCVVPYLISEMFLFCDATKCNTLIDKNKFIHY